MNTIILEVIAGILVLAFLLISLMKYLTDKDIEREKARNFNIIADRYSNNNYSKSVSKYYRNYKKKKHYFN